MRCSSCTFSPVRFGPALLLPLALLAGCGGDAGSSPPPGAAAAAQGRVSEVQSALDRWRDAQDVETAHDAAETVSNLVTGPGVDLYGDADGDGTVRGEVDDGLLPGQDGETSLGLPLAGCAGPDLLGGDWDDPVGRWADLTGRIAAWSPTANPLPVFRQSCAAHRRVGPAHLDVRGPLRRPRVLRSCPAARRRRARRDRRVRMTLIAPVLTVLVILAGVRATRLVATRFYRPAVAGRT